MFTLSVLPGVAGEAVGEVAIATIAEGVGEAEAEVEVIEPRCDRTTTEEDMAEEGNAVVSTLTIRVPFPLSLD